MEEISQKKQKSKDYMAQKKNRTQPKPLLPEIAGIFPDTYYTGIQILIAPVLFYTDKSMVQLKLISDTEFYALLCCSYCVIVK